jgi:hypothetical protein
MAFEADNSYNSDLDSPDVRFASPEEISFIYAQAETLCQYARTRGFRKLFDGMKVSFSKKVDLSSYKYADGPVQNVVWLRTREDGSIFAQEKETERFEDRTHIFTRHIVIRDSEALASQEMIMSLGVSGDLKNNYVPDPEAHRKCYAGKVPSDYLVSMQLQIDKIWDAADISSFKG